MFCACCTYIEAIKVKKITPPLDMEQAESELRAAMYHDPQKQPKPCLNVDHLFNYGYAHGMLQEMFILRSILKGNAVLDNWEERIRAGYEQEMTPQNNERKCEVCGYPLAQDRGSVGNRCSIHKVD